jgi:O-antigen ligase
MFPRNPDSLTRGRGDMGTVVFGRVNLVLLAGAVVTFSVLVGTAVGMGWTRPLIVAAGVVVFVALVRDIRFSVPLLLLVIPFGPKVEMSFGNLYVATGLLIVVVAAWLWRNSMLAVPFRFPLNPVLIALVILSVIMLVSASQMHQRLLGDRTALLRLIQFFLYVALFAVVLQMDLSVGRIKALLALTLLAGAVEGLIGMREWFVHPGLYVGGTFDGQHNHFAVYCVFIALLLLGVILETGNVKTRLPALAALAVLVFAIVFSFSRGGYAALAAGIVAFLFMPIRRGLKIALAAGAGAGFVVVYSLVPIPVIERAYSIYTSVAGGDAGISFGARLVMWKRGFANFLAHPVLGTGAWGPGLMDNSYVKVLAESGALGFAAFAGLFYVILREEWRILRRRPRDAFMRGIVTGMFPASIACLVVYNLTGDFFGVHRFMGVFWIVLALVLKYGAAMGDVGGKAHGA